MNIEIAGQAMPRLGINEVRKHIKAHPDISPINVGNVSICHTFAYRDRYDSKNKMEFETDIFGGLLAEREGRAVIRRLGRQTIRFSIYPSAVGIENAARAVGLEPGSDTFRFKDINECEPDGLIQGANYLKAFAEGWVPLGTASKRLSYDLERSSRPAHDRKPRDHVLGQLWTPDSFKSQVIAAAQKGFDYRYNDEVRKDVVDTIDSFSSAISLFNRGLEVAGETPEIPSPDSYRSKDAHQSIADVLICIGAGLDIDKKVRDILLESRERALAIRDKFQAEDTHKLVA